MKTLTFVCALCGKLADGTVSSAGEELPDGWLSMGTPYGAIRGCSADHVARALTKQVEMLGEKSTLGYIEGAPMKKKEMPS